MLSAVERNSQLTSSIHIFSSGKDESCCRGKYYDHRNTDGDYEAFLLDSPFSLKWTYTNLHPLPFVPFGEAVDTCWFVTINKPQNGLLPGIYKGLRDGGSPGIYITGPRGFSFQPKCDLEILELNYDDEDNIDSFAANLYIKHGCFDYPPLFMAIRHNSAMPVKAKVEDLQNRRHLPESFFFFRVYATEFGFNNPPLNKVYCSGFGKKIEAYDDDDEEDDEDDEAEDDEDDDDDFEDLFDDSNYYRQHDFIHRGVFNPGFNSTHDSEFKYSLFNDGVDGIAIKIEPYDDSEHKTYWSMTFHSKNGFSKGIQENSNNWPVHQDIDDPCLQITSSVFGEYERGVYKVLEIEQDSLGRLLRLAINFKAYLFDEAIEGAIRLNSSVPINLDNPME